MSDPVSGYWVRYGDLNWVEVDEAEYVRVERAAGFHNTLGQPDKPGTAAFSNGVLEGTTIRPREIEHE